MPNSVLHWAVVCLGVFTAWRAAAAPENFMVGNLVFERPAAWRWTEPTTTSHLIRLDATGDTPGKTLCYYYHAPKPTNSTQAIIREQLGKFFPQSTNQTQIKQEQVSKFSLPLTYVEVTGDYYWKGARSEAYSPDHRMLLAVISDEGGFIFARLVGPDAKTTALRETFRRMIESALTQQP